MICGGLYDNAAESVTVAGLGLRIRFRIYGDGTGPIVPLVRTAFPARWFDSDARFP